MANPQREKGHTDIANEIVETLAMINLRPYEWRTLWALWRKTWGWHKKKDKISLTQFQELTKLERRHQCKALKTLIEKNIITRNRDSYIVSYGFQKDYSLWKVVPKQAPVDSALSSACLSTKVVPKQAPKLVPKQAPTKETKETIQKKGAGSASACQGQALPAKKHDPKVCEDFHKAVVDFKKEQDENIDTYKGHSTQVPGLPG